MLLGACLLLAAILTMVFWNLGISSSEKQAKSYVATLLEILPEPQNAVLEERGDNDMPVLSVDETDFVGIIELPRFGSVLPVGAEWGESSKYPCRFSGSLYEGTMKIGATTQKGQFDFYRELSVEDTLLYTDMEGNKYTLKITSLRYEDHADKTTLTCEEAPLTLFIKNIYSSEYLVLSCSVLH